MSGSDAAWRSRTARWLGTDRAADAASQVDRSANASRQPAAADGNTVEAWEPAAARPLYARMLRLRQLDPGGFLCFLFFEGAIVLAALLVLAELVEWWTLFALPAVVAAMVKLNDEVAVAVYRRASLVPHRERERFRRQVEPVVGRAAVPGTSAAGHSPDRVTIRARRARRAVPTELPAAVRARRAPMRLRFARGPNEGRADELRIPPKAAESITPSKAVEPTPAGRPTSSQPTHGGAARAGDDRPPARSTSSSTGGRQPRPDGAERHAARTDPGGVNPGGGSHRAGGHWTSTPARPGTAAHRRRQSARHRYE